MATGCPVIVRHFCSVSAGVSGEGGWLKQVASGFRGFIHQSVPKKDTKPEWEGWPQPGGWHWMSAVGLGLTYELSQGFSLQN
jgi:hypothetical protein